MARTAASGWALRARKIFVGAMMVILIFSSLASMRADAANPPNVWVSGKIQMPLNFTGISNAIVIIQDTVDVSNQGGALTDAGGNYTVGIYAASLREFRITAFHSDYYYNTTTVTLSNGTNQTDVNITLNPVGAKNAWVTGRVYDGITMAPLQNVGVLALTSDYINSDTTDALGDYLINIVSFREYTIHIADTTVGNTTYKGQDIIKYFGFLDFTTMNFYLEPMNCTLRGLVRNATGVPIGNSTVRVYCPVERPESGRMTEYYPSVNQTTGEYSVNVTRGIWHVEASDNARSRYGQTLTVTMNSNQTTWQNLTLADMNPLPVIVYGNVTHYGNGTLAAGVGVNIGLTNESWRNGTLTDGTGFYSMQAAPGDLRMEASLDWNVSSFEEFHADPGDVLNFDLVLTPYNNSAWIEGYVRINGTGVADVSVPAVFGRYTWRNTTDGSGHYNISAPAADFEIEVERPGYEPITAWVSTSPGVASVQDFDLQPLQWTGDIRGYVDDGLGKGLDTAVVWLIGGGWSAPLGTDYSGFFQKTASPGDIDYIIFAPGYDVATGTVAVNPGGATWLNVSLTKLPTAGKVFCRLTNIRTGEPIARAKVTLSSTSPTYWKDVETDGNGRFNSTVPPGILDLDFNAWDNGFLNPGQMHFEVAPGIDRWLNLSFFPRDNSSRIKGTIYNITNASALPGANVTMRMGDVFCATSSNLTGYYEMNTSAGTYDIWARAPGYRVNRTLFKQAIGAYADKTEDIILAYAPAWFTGAVSDNVTDTDGDTLYDELTLDVSLFVNVSDTYRIVGDLSEGRSLSNTIATSARAIALGTGAQNVTLSFNGNLLRGSKADGYFVRLRLTTAANESDTIDVFEHFTARCSYTDFDAPDALIAGPSYQALMDTDGDSLQNLLIVNATLNVTKAGNYTISYALTDTFGAGVDQGIVWDYYSVGNHTIETAFEGVQIYAHGVDLGACVMYLIEGVPSEASIAVQTFYVYTVYGYDIFQRYSMDSSVSGYVRNATGDALPGISVTLYNVTNRFLSSTKTDGTGFYNLSAWAGDWLLVVDDPGARPSRYQGDLLDLHLNLSEAKTIDLNLAFSNMDETDIHVEFYNPSDWNRTKVDSLTTPRTDADVIRFNFDVSFWWVGNGDGYISEEEVAKLEQIMAWPSLPGNSSGLFNVDGIPFALDSGNMTRDISAAGPVNSTSPLSVHLVGYYNATVPTIANHTLTLNATYDNTPSAMGAESNMSYVYYVKAPGYWNNTGNTTTLNITISGDGTDLVTADPQNDSNPSDSITSEWVSLNFSSRTTLSDYGQIYGTVTINGTSDRSGVTVTAILNSTQLPVAFTQTDSAGNYSLVGLPVPRNYDILAERPGYNSSRVNNVGLIAASPQDVDFWLLPTPPTISTENVTCALLNNTVEIYADIFDLGVIDKAYLYYAPVGSFMYQQLPMARVANTPTHTATIPAQASTGAVHYYVWANNTGGGSASSPPGAPAGGNNYTIEIYESRVDFTPSYWRTYEVLNLTSTNTNYSTKDASQVTLWFRRSADNATWTSWTNDLIDLDPWNGVWWPFNCSAHGGEGYYEFYSIATDNKSKVEKAPAVADAAYNYDGTAPSSFINPVGQYWWNATNLFVSINVSDSGSSGLRNCELYVNYSADNVTWGGWGVYLVTYSPWPNPVIMGFDFPNGPGFYNLSSRVYDNASNAEAVPTIPDIMCAFDNVTPTTALDPVASYWQTTSPINLPGHGFDNGTSGFFRSYLVYRYSANNNTGWTSWVNVGYNVTPTPWGEFNGVFAFPNGPGYYEFYTLGLDNASNWETHAAVADLKLAYDNAAPTSSVNSPVGYWQASAPFAMTGIASDTGTSGLRNVTLWSRFSSDNSTWGGWFTTGLTDAAPWDGVNWSFAFGNGTGFYEFYSIAVDNASLMEAAPANNDTCIGYDPNLPSISAFSILPSPCEFGQSINISASVSDLSGISSVTVAVSLGASLLGNYTMNRSGQLSWLAFTPASVGNFTITLWVVDSQGQANTTQGSVTVRDTTAPSLTGLTSTPYPVEVPGAVNVTVNVTDLSSISNCTINITDPGGAWLLNESMLQVGMSRVYCHERTYAILGNYTFVIWALDSQGNGVTLSGVVRTVDTQSPLANAGTSQSVEMGTAVMLDASPSYDNYAIDNYTWVFNDNGLKRLYGQFANYTFNNIGSFEISLTVRDIYGNPASAKTWVNVTPTSNTGIVTGTVLDANGNAVAGATVYVEGASPPIEATTDSLGRFVLMNVSTGSRTIVVVANGYKRFTQEVTVQKGQTSSVGAITLEAETVSSALPDWLWYAVAGIAIGVAVAIAAILLIAARKRKAKSAKTVIDEIFLMYSDGRLVKHFTRRLRPDMDSDILSSMLVAVQDFVKDSFKGEDGMLDEMKFGRFQILLGRGKHIILAAIVLGEELDVLKPQVQKCVADIEEKYAAQLKDWDGDMGKLTGSFKYVMDLIDGRYA